MALLFVGDFLDDFDQPPPDLERLGRQLRARGYRLIPNLEGPLRGVAYDRSRGIVLSQGLSAIADLGRLDTAAVNLANNHIMDWGAEGLERTLRALDEAGIAHFGAGRDLAQASRLEIIEEAGRRVGLLGFGWSAEECLPATGGGPGVAPLRARRVLEAIRRSRPRVDYLVASLHWGYEYERLPLPVDRELARRAVDAGADLVIGHHPHVIQAIESYRQGRIFYSLGNFFFGSRREDFTALNPIAAIHSQDGMGIELAFQGGAQVTPVYFRYAAGQTGFRDVPPEVLDLTAISLEAYDAYFQANRTVPWRPLLKSGALQRPLNALRSAGFAARLGVARLARALGIHAELRRLVARLRPPGA